MRNAAITNPEGSQFLKALFEGVPDDQYLEIRTMEKGRGARKKFYKLSRLREQGFEVALPGYLDRKANIYYGVAPRYEPRPAESDADRGDAVNLVTTLWLDEITRPASDLSPFSWMVETSVGNVQAGYLLKGPTCDVDRVEQLNRRLAAAVGGDNVWNRGRILRLPGFINLNHPGDQRARLLELHPHRRYTLDELDRLLPPLPQEDTEGGPRGVKGQYHTGSFDPHWPYALSPVLQDRLVDFFRRMSLQRCPDGRFSGACPLPHRDGVACDCDRAFYASPFSGSWTCFCSDHLGPTSGTITAFASLGFRVELSLAEMQSQIGRHHLGPGEVRFRTGSPAQGGAIYRKNNVALTVLRNQSLHRKSDRRKYRGKRPKLWEEAQALFPLPAHIQPRVKGCLLWSERDCQGLAVDLLSNTWRNPANAQYKRQKLYFNILPRINGIQLYQRKVAVDDWDKKVHKRISRAIQRAMKEGQGWMWFDNFLDRGYILYLTNVPGLSGFEPVGEARLALVDALKCIHPPGRDEGEGRFRPYDGSDNWVGKAENSGEDDEGRWETIAVSQEPTDFAGLEAECVVSGVVTEYRPAYWRGQPYHGLAMRYPNKESFVAFARSFPDQYVLTRSALSDRYLEVK